jgi:hypothetical protein
MSVLLVVTCFICTQIMRRVRDARRLVAPSHFCLLNGKTNPNFSTAAAVIISD